MSLRRTSANLAAALLLAGCDIPTEAPILVQRWILPIENTSVSVAELVPDGVTVSGANFSISVPALIASRSLGELCPACTALNGATAPTPPFSTSFNTTTTLPTNVSSATVASGTAQITVQNGLSFDPTQGGGSVTITVTDVASGRQLGQVALGSGQLPAGATVSRTLAIAPGTVGSTLRATTQVTSAGGQVATINTSQRVTATATVQSLLVSRADVNVSGRLVDLTNVDLPDLPEIGDEVQEGAIILDVTNPFGVSVAAQLRIQHSGGVITKPFTIGTAPTSTVRITLTREEWRTIFDDDDVTLSGTGTVSGGTITVTPAQQVGIRARLDLTLRLPS